ncbi:hypothetical protein FB451DRAFT_1170457 [Mycena latifolia]|nr:hypothetical protein FB451DRAFT_1170457 [Mycena latifolia]
MWNRKRGSNGCQGSGKLGLRMRVRILLGYRRASSANDGAGRRNEGVAGRKRKRWDHNTCTHAAITQLNTATRQQERARRQRAARPCCRADEHPNSDKDSDLPPDIVQPLS